MPRDANGTYTLPPGNPVVPGTVIASDWANDTMPDVGTEMSDSLSRLGKGGMQAPLKLINGAVDAPAQTFNQDLLAGRYLFSVGDMRDTLQNEDKLRFTVDGVFVFIDGEWVPINPNLTGRKNYLMNGDFDIWQRGANFIDAGPSAFYTSDRWFADPRSEVNCSVTRHSFALEETDVPDLPEFFLRYTLNTAAALGGVQQRIEGVRTLAGQTATLTFYARTFASTATIRPRLSQNFAGGSATILTEGDDTVLTGTFQKITQVFDVPDIDGKVIGTPGNDFLGVIFAVLDDATYAIDIAHVQFEVGPKGTKFEKTPIAETLALCKRYYERYDRDLNTDIFFGKPGKNITITQARFYIEFAVEKRAQPVLTFQNPTAWNLENDAGSSVPAVSILNTPSGTKSARVTVEAAGGLVPGYANLLTLQPTATLEIYAEL